MQEPINEKISLLIDGDLESDKALTLLKAVQADDVLKSKLQRYQLMSQVLKNEDCLLLDRKFTDKIHQQIRQEPTYLIPSKTSKINWQKAGLAVAASVTLAVVCVVNQIDRSSNAYSEPQMALIAPQPIQADAAFVHFDEYLQAHDNDVYVNNVRVHPYAHIVGYQQE